MTNERKAILADELIDTLIEYNGLDWMIEYLLTSGYKYAELINMQFDGADVQRVASDIGWVL